MRSIAFPSISTGAYGFPVDRAARIAITEIKTHLDQNELPERVLIICFDNNTYKAYLGQLQG